MLKQFDKNGDGKLDDKEKEAAKKAMQNRKVLQVRMSREEVMKKYDTDKDGKLNETEKKKLVEDIKKKVQQQLKEQKEIQDGTKSEV